MKQPRQTYTNDTGCVLLLAAIFSDRLEYRQCLRNMLRAALHITANGDRTPASKNPRRNAE